MRDSWTLALTCILVKSGRLKIFWRLAHLRPFFDLGLAAGEVPAGIVGVDDDPIAGRLELAGGDLIDQLCFLLLFELQCRLPGQLVRHRLLDFGSQFLDRFAPSVIVEQVEFVSRPSENHFFAFQRLFRRINAVFDVELGHDIGGRGGPSVRGKCVVNPLASATGPVQSGLGLLNGGLGRYDLSLQRVQLLLVDPVDILDAGDLGDLAGQLRVLVGS